MRKRNLVSEAWAGIDVQLQKRPAWYIGSRSGLGALGHIGNEFSSSFSSAIASSSSPPGSSSGSGGGGFSGGGGGGGGGW